MMDVVNSPGESKVILVSGLMKDEYEKSREALMDAGVKLIDGNNALGDLQSEIAKGGEQIIVVNRPNLLGEMISTAGNEEAQQLLELSERSDDPKEKLLEWLKEAHERNPGAAPEVALKSVLDSMRAALGGLDMKLAIAPQSALALALATFVREKQINETSIGNTHNEYGGMGEALMVIKIEGGTIVVEVNGVPVGSRPLD